MDDHFIIIDYYYGYGMLQCSAVQVLVENGIQIQRFQRVELWNCWLRLNECEMSELNDDRPNFSFFFVNDVEKNLFILS